MDLAGLGKPIPAVEPSACPFSCTTDRRIVGSRGRGRARRSRQRGSSVAMALEAIIDHQADEDVPALRAGLGYGVVVSAVGERTAARSRPSRRPSRRRTARRPRARRTRRRATEIRCDELLLVRRDRARCTRGSWSNRLGGAKPSPWLQTNWTDARSRSRTRAPRHAARGLLRPRLRVRVHAGRDAARRRPDVRRGRVAACSCWPRSGGRGRPTRG